MKVHVVEYCNKSPTIGNRNNVLYVVFHKLSDDTSYFSNERT